MRKSSISQAMCLAIAIAVAAQATRVGAGEAAGKESERFTFKLNEGSSIICKPKLASLPLKTSFAEIKIPLQKVETIRIDHEAETVTVSLLNGDRLQGRCNLEGFTVETIVGDLTIPLSHIVEVVTTLKKEPVFDDSPAKRNACINSLRQMDAAKEQWAMANRRRDGDPADINAVNRYIKGARTPICPAGGKYTYHPIGANPECGVPGHALP